MSASIYAQEENAMKRIVMTSAIALFMGLAQPALAEDKETPPGDMALDGISRLMEALGAFISSLPQYEAPVMNENGDIIIRRKNPPPPDKKEPKLEETAT
jgi:hypothetical protein|tara:strand:+ start:2899 stop:3198 length:300 start_codon:yes stop_codon:yes gene_type:complete